MSIVRRVLLTCSSLLCLLPIAACCFGQGLNWSPSGQVTTLGPGFTPDPMLLTGTAGGPAAAQSMHGTCRGYLPILPSHLLRVTAPMHLRLLVHSEQDTTLVVRLADGSYLCNDDADGVDPIVEHDFPAGDHIVWVGTYGSGLTANYQLALTTNPSLRPSALAGAPSSGAAGADTDGPVLMTGTGIVQSATGNLPGVTPGSTCTYTKRQVVPPGNFDCRWRVECSGIVVYGEGSGGYNPCQDPSWGPGVLVRDANTESGDGDPSFVIEAGRMIIRSDERGTRGPYTIEATVVATPPG